MELLFSFLTLPQPQAGMLHSSCCIFPFNLSVICTSVCPLISRNKVIPDFKSENDKVTHWWVGCSNHLVPVNFDFVLALQLLTRTYTHLHPVSTTLYFQQALCIKKEVLQHCFWFMVNYWSVCPHPFYAGLSLPWC